jgi:hypothetical protein
MSKAWRGYLVADVRITPDLLMMLSKRRENRRIAHVLITLSGKSTTDPGEVSRSRVVICIGIGTGEKT